MKKEWLPLEPASYPPVWTRWAPFVTIFKVNEHSYTGIINKP